MSSLANVQLWFCRRVDNVCQPWEVIESQQPRWSDFNELILPNESTNVIITSSVILFSLIMSSFKAELGLRIVSKKARHPTDVMSLLYERSTDLTVELLASQPARVSVPSSRVYYLVDKDSLTQNWCSNTARWRRNATQLYWLRHCSWDQESSKFCCFSSYFQSLTILRH